MGIITNVRDTSDCSNQQKPKSPTTDDQHQLDMIKRNFALSALAIAATLLSNSSQATLVDLTGSNNEGSANGALFVFTNQQPTGTGIIDPFLRVQGEPTESGYNTSGGTPFDDKAGPWTHDIQLSDLEASRISLNGTEYYKLLLDANEPGGNKSLISLDRLEFYTSSEGSKTTLDVASLGTLRFSLDGNGDNSVLLDAQRNHGSGSGDIYAYIPASNFSGASQSDFVYMFVHFGGADASEGGFEEWAIVNAITPVPELNALFPIVGLMVAVGSTHVLRRRKMARIAADV